MGRARSDEDRCARGRQHAGRHGARLTLAGDLPIPPKTAWTSEYALVVPSVAASIPHSLEYAVFAWAGIDQLATQASVPIALVRPRAGDYARVNDPQGRPERVLVVEVRGPVTLVQWPDGRPATWVASDAVLFDA